jgi:hypothetical protein
MVFNTQYIWIAAAVVAVLVVILLIARGVRRSRTVALRDKYGREYDRTVEAAGSRSVAEEDLMARAQQASELEIRPVAAADRARYRDEWRKIETRFIDRPTTAVVEADELIRYVLRRRGYPMADFEEHAKLISVRHPKLVEHYHAGHEVIDRREGGAPSTEELRQAMLHYRALFDELVHEGADRERPIAPVVEDRPQV